MTVADRRIGGPAIDGFADNVAEGILEQDCECFRTHSDLYVENIPAWPLSLYPPKASCLLSCLADPRARGRCNFSERGEDRSEWQKRRKD